MLTVDSFCRRVFAPRPTDMILYYLFIILFSFYSIYWNAKAAKGVNASLAAVLLMEKCDYFTSGQFFASLARSAMGRPNRLIKPFASN